VTNLIERIRYGGFDHLFRRNAFDECQGIFRNLCQQFPIPRRWNDSAARDAESVAIEPPEVVTFAAANLRTGVDSFFPRQCRRTLDGRRRDEFFFYRKHCVLLELLINLSNESGQLHRELPAERPHVR
jgi:hypothetical protein